MKMEKMPEVKHTEDGAFWKNAYEKFEARIYVPKSTLQGDILNYGFIAPYLLVFADHLFSEDEAVTFAREKGLAEGRAEGRKQGLAEGRAEGLAEGALQKAIEAAIVLIKDFNATPELAAKKMNAPLDKVLEALK